MNKKKISILVVSIIGLIIALIGLTYAYLRKSPTQVDTNTISTLNCLDVSITNVTDGITLNDASPITDAQGITLTPYRFKIVNNCPTSAIVNISLESLAIDNQLDLNYVDYSINEIDSETVSPLKLKNASTNTVSIIENAVSKLIYSDVFLKKRSEKTFDLRLWIDDRTPNSQMSKAYKGKIVLTATPTDLNVEPNKCVTNEDNYVNGQYTYTYNSELGGYKVSLLDPDSTEPVTTTLCSSINNKPIISMDSMFASSQATSIDLSSFDTSNVTNMSYMFAESQATNIDLSSFDTSNVTNMSAMFYYSQATNIDLSSFDTSNVTDMSMMFNRSQATNIDLSSFDTSNVTDMSMMFDRSQATNIDLSSFDTSNVTDMSYMFAETSNLKTIYVTDKFITSKLNSGSYMFLSCYNLVGGAGTTYNSNKYGKEYAHIDGGTSNPGYFTDIKDKN